MVFSSVPVYLDPPNWQQQHNHQQQGNGASENPQLLPPPHGGGGSIRPGSMADRARLAKIPQPETALKCPRCDSTNTKFCYFNNYSLSQPRHFCKTCRRYWTRGGALRNVPVGGGCRKNNKKSKSSKSPASSADDDQKKQQIGSNSTNVVNVIPNSEITDHHHLPVLQQTPNNLPFMASLQNFPQFSLGNIGLNFGGIHQGGQASIGQAAAADMGFQIGTNSAGQQQFSFFEPITNGHGLYPFQMSEGMEGASNSMVEISESQLLRSRVSEIAPAAKMENNNRGGLNLSRSLIMGASDQSNQYWGGGNSWTDLSGLNSSTTN